MVLIGAGRSFIAGADIRQFGKARSGSPAAQHLDVLDDEREAVVAAIHGYALGGGLEHAHGLQLPHRRAERQGRPARGADRHPAGRRRHAAPAAPDRPEGGDGDDRQRPPRAGRRSEEARHHRRDRRREGTCAARRSRFAKSIADKRPLPRVRDNDRPSSPKRKADPGMFEAMRKIDRAQGAQPEGAVSLHRVPSRRRRRSRSRRASRPSAAVRASWRTPTRRRRCATPSSPSARWRRSPGAAEGSQAAAKIEDRGGDRRRHDGRRHRHVLRRRRHPGEDPRRHAGGARQAACSASRQLRRQRQARQHHAGSRWTSGCR